jgi:cell division protein FtsB
MISKRPTTPLERKALERKGNDPLATHALSISPAHRSKTDPRSGLEKRENRKLSAVRSRSLPLLKVLVLILLMVDICLLCGIFMSPRGINGYRAQQAEVLRLAALTSSLAQENQRLADRVRYLKVDQSAQERLVKQELGWVHPDEIIVEFATPLSP